MSLRTFFGGKDDAVTIYRRELMQAVRDGDTGRLQELLKSNIDAPPEALDAPLDRAISKNQTRIAQILLDAPGARALSTGTLRSVVYGERAEMFRLLADKGFNFAEYVPGEQGASYVAALRYLQKDYECAKLRLELQEAKKELTTLRRAAGMPEPSETPAIRNFNL